MTEVEWLACEDPATMLDFLRNRITDRKLRLFGVACCRRILHLMADERSRRAVEVAEMFADGLVTDVEAEAVGNAAAEVTGEGFQNISEELGWRAARAADHLLPLPAESWQLKIVWEYVATALEGEQLIREGANPEVMDVWSEQIAESGRPIGWTSLNPEKIIAETLREIVGLIPFRPIAVSPTILAWNSGSVPKIARTIYDERVFDRLPILADALEDAGCHEAECQERGE